MRVGAVVVAAGKGLRFKSTAPKLLAKIGSKPIIIYCLRTLQRHPLIGEIVLVVNSGIKSAITKQLRQYRITKVSAIVEGGRRRQDSVYCGFKAMGRSVDLVLIHDAARPFARKQDISAVIKEAAKTGAAVLGAPVKCTIKSVVRRSSSAYPERSRGVVRRLTVEKTLDRNNLWEIQTPQAFKKDLILQAFKLFGRQDVTDDAMLVEKLGRKVSIVVGSYSNIKITTPEDLIIAEALFKNNLLSNEFSR